MESKHIGRILSFCVTTHLLVKGGKKVVKSINCQMSFDNLQIEVDPWDLLINLSLGLFLG